MIIEEYEGTTVVPPDCTAGLDEAMNIVIRVDSVVTNDIAAEGSAHA